MLELAILGLLEEQELHGYELRKRLGETLGFLVSVSFGSLYPALARLEASGAVVTLAPPGVGAGGVAAGGVAAGGVGAGGVGAGPEELRRIPMTGSLAGERAAFRASRTTPRVRGGYVGAARTTRQRRVYAITEAGTAMFNRLLAGDGNVGEAEDDRCFALRLAFARYLSPDARIRLLERRKVVLTQRRARSALSESAATDTWRAALAEHGAESLDGDINWLDRLIEAERARTTSAGDPAEPTPRKVAST